MIATHPEFAQAPGSSPLAVSCRGVVKDFGDGDTRIRVLHEIDLDVPAGELALLVGPSGCGKTTLISIIAGLLDPTAGDVSLFGTPPFQALKPPTNRLSSGPHRFRVSTVQLVAGPECHSQRGDSAADWPRATQPGL